MDDHAERIRRHGRHTTDHALEKPRAGQKGWGHGHQERDRSQDYTDGVRAEPQPGQHEPASNRGVTVRVGVHRRAEENGGVVGTAIELHVTVEVFSEVEGELLTWLRHIP